MKIPSSEPILPDQGGELPPDRLRRRRRVFSPDAAETKSAAQSLAHLLSPSFDYYLGFLLAGIIAAAGMLFDAPGLTFLAVLFTPFLGPVFGLPLSAVLDSPLFFLKSFVHLILGSGLVFGIGALAGWISANLPPGRAFSQILVYTAPSWANLIVVAVGAALTAYLMVRSPRQKPLVANIAAAYGLVLPLSASGFSLTARIPTGMESGLEQFLIHLSLAALIALILYFSLGLKPAKIFGYAMTLALIGVSITAMFVFAGLLPAEETPVAQVETSPSPILPETPVASPAPSGTWTPTREEITLAPGQPTSTKTVTPTPSDTPTATVTLAPTPVWAKISAPSGGGAYIRAEPGGKILSSLLNGSPVTVISEPVRIEGGTIWVQIRTEDGVLGWILQSLLVTATPSPGW